MLADVIAAFSAAGGLVGLGSLIAAIGAWRKSSSAAKQLTPNHGSSLSDKIDLVLKLQEAHGELQRSQGHQLGEIRADQRAGFQQLHERVSTLERRR